MKCEKVVNHMTKEMCGKDGKIRPGIMECLCAEHYKHVNNVRTHKYDGPITNPRAFRKTSVWS
jgi:hypothetical protein